MSQRLDGNSLAGPLAEAFQTDPTMAVGRCRGCGDSSPLATSIVYSSDMGRVGRCAQCDNVLYVHVGTPGGTFLNIQGMTSLTFAAPR